MDINLCHFFLLLPHTHILRFQMLLLPLILPNIVINLINHILLQMLQLSYSLLITIRQLNQSLLQLFPTTLTLQLRHSQLEFIFLFGLQLMSHFLLEQIDRFVTFYYVFLPVFDVQHWRLLHQLVIFGYTR